MSSQNDNSMSAATHVGTPHVGTAAPGCPVERSSTAPVSRLDSIRSQADWGVIRSGAVFQADRRARPERHREGISRGLERIGQHRIFLSLVLLTMTTWGQAFGQAMTKGIMSPPANVRPPHLQNVGIEQHLDAQVPPDLTFVDDTGRTVKLGDYFGTQPLILNLVYYNCTMLCGEALAGSKRLHEDGEV